MLHDVDVFMSKHDISSGERWGVALARTLVDSNFGVILLTPSNLNSSWLLFEAGAIAKLEEGKACCLVLGDLSPADIQAPLSQFQNRRFTKTDIRQLLSDVNQEVGASLEPDQFDLMFEKWWPDLDSAYRAAIASAGTQVTTAPRRSSDDLLQEILLTVRELSRQRQAPALHPGFQPATLQGDLLSQPVSESSLTAYTAWKFQGKTVSDIWQRKLLRDLDLSRFPTIRHIDDAVELARPAVVAYATEAPDLFPTGTDYITKALGFVDSDFRSHHNFGVQTREAFDRLGHLVRDA